MSVKDGRQKSSARVSSLSRKPTKSNSPVSLVSQKKQPSTALNERRSFPSPDGEIKSSGLAAYLAKNSAVSRSKTASRNSSIDGPLSSIRSSTGSCHDACKFGGHRSYDDSNAAAKSEGRSTAKKVSKVVGATKKPSKVVGATTKLSRIGTAAVSTSKPAISSPRIGAVNVSKIAVAQSSVRSGISDASASKSVLKTPRAKLNSVNGRVQNSVNSRVKTSVNSRVQNSVHSRVQNSVTQNTVNGRHQTDSRSVKSSRSSNSTPEGKFKVARSLFRSPGATNGSKILSSKICEEIMADSRKWQSSTAARSLLASFDSPRHDLLSQASGVAFNCQILDDKAEEEFFRQYSPPAPENCGFNAALKYQEASEISVEAFSGDQFSDFSEISPRSLEMYEDAGKGDSSGNTDNGNVMMRFRRGKGMRHSEDSNAEPENVVLRHQDLQGRKATEEYLINHVIGEAVNKLSHYEESKVKVLVGAFETVISLRDSHQTEELKNDGVDHTRPLQTCN